MFLFFTRLFVAVGLLVSVAANEGIDRDHSLRDAAVAGNVNDVRYWIQQGAAVDSASPGGWTSLIYAADRSHSEVVDVLLQANADPNICEGDGWSPLMFSAVKGNIEICRLLIRGGADLEHVSKNDWSPLKAAQRSKNPDMGAFMESEIAKSKELKVDNVGLGRDFLQAVKDSDVDLARDMLDRRGIDPNTLSPNGWTGVTYAAANGNIEMMKMLLSHGTDVNKSDKDGWTPLMFASFQGNSDAVELLLAHGADVLVKNVAQTSALNMATNYAKHKNDDSVKRLITAAGMAQALRREDLDGVSDMIELGGADVNFQDTRPNSGKWTPLILATAKHNREAVTWMIDKGADPNVPERDGWTPLFFAVFSDDAELCRVIIGAGSDSQRRLPNGKSALDLARERNVPAVIEVLAEHEELERRVLESSKSADPQQEILPNAVETGPSKEELDQERIRQEQEQRQQKQQREQQQQRDREESRRRRQAEQQQKEEYLEEDIRYEDVELVEPEGLMDKVLSFLGF